ncbi:formylglycine-generating enzyme family protein [Pendulispora albinea]|uniref:Formylglycine-generating enzyme family protein n=1 Tax=Pendulispora albinea TaxID=2741071 RepID=A0ABZ2MAX0_9BACT
MTFAHVSMALLVACLAVPLYAKPISGASSTPRKPPAPLEARRPKPPRPVETVRVAGNYCTEIEQRCLRWLPNTKEVVSHEPLRCAEFAPSVCKGQTRPMTFEIDRYEYPGRAGVRPQVNVTWVQAGALCAARGKRLCTEEEWTLACEGDSLWPYPYGLVRDASACHIDEPLRPSAHQGSPERNARVGPHWKMPIDQREPSGKRPACVSPFGVFDMTGNVDEWVDGHASGHASSSMGGYWGPVRNRCRVVTRAHDAKFSFYQTGFRCCRDVP